jgi:hypothetical protein
MGHGKEWRRRESGWTTTTTTWVKYVTFGLLHGGLAMKSTYAMYDYSLNYINLDLWQLPIHSPLTRLYPFDEQTIQ